jgi:glycosyltransferase involved in cell wall biosynthesis
MIKIFYDGWSLVYQPNSPTAIHLLSLMAAHPPEFPAALGLPGEPFHSLPQGFEILTSQTSDTEWGRLQWTQRVLPALANRAKADLIHLVGSSPALFGAGRTLVSPADFQGVGLPAEQIRQPTSFATRLSQALAVGGLERKQALLWPDDLPIPEGEKSLHSLPPVVHPIFRIGARLASPTKTLQDELTSLDLPETYLLYHGPSDEATLHRLLDSWSWAAGSIGEYYPLVLVGLEGPAQDRLAALLAEYQLSGTARPLPALSLPALAAIYQGCSALFHPAEVSPWGDPARIALACGKPLVGLESARAAALSGPAGYLISTHESYPATCRALGAALITVVVEESVAEALSRNAQARSAAWQFERFARRLREYYLAWSESIG